MVDLSLSAFIRDEQRGLGPILRYMNMWGPVIAEGHPHLTVVRYEQLVQDPPGTFDAVLRGLGVNPVSEPAVQRAVEASSFEAMQRQKTEHRKRLDPSGDIPTDTLRVRRGATAEPHGLLSDDAVYLDRTIMRRLHAAFAEYRD